MSLIAAIILGAALAITGMLIGLIVGHRYGYKIGKVDERTSWTNLILDDEWPLLREHMKWKEQKESEFPKFIQ